jgi:hypothetical protein
MKSSTVHLSLVNGWSNLGTELCLWVAEFRNPNNGFSSFSNCKPFVTWELPIFLKFKRPVQKDKMERQR